MFRLINTSRATLIVPSQHISAAAAGPGGAPFTTIANAIAAALAQKTECTVTVPEGDYKETFTVPDGVSLVGKGTVNVTGIVNLAGKGTISNVNMQVCIVQAGANRILEKCEFTNLNVQPGGVIHGRQIVVQATLNGNKANIFISTSTISGTPALCLAAGTTCSIEASTIEGPTNLSGKTILDCKQTSVVGGQNDLFVVSDPESVLQLFNCMVSGQGRVKSGPGSSVRANVTALGTANAFVGGKDVKLSDV